MIFSEAQKTDWVCVWERDCVFVHKLSVQTEMSQQLLYGRNWRFEFLSTTTKSDSLWFDELPKLTPSSDQDFEHISTPLTTLTSPSL